MSFQQGARYYAFGLFSGSIILCPCLLIRKWGKLLWFSGFKPGFTIPYPIFAHIDFKTKTALCLHHQPHSVTKVYPWSQPPPLPPWRGGVAAAKRPSGAQPDRTPLIIKGRQLINRHFFERTPSDIWF